MITIKDIEAAAARLKSVAVTTPLISCPALDERVSGRILLKAECLQRTGSFKIRGAYNLMSQLTPGQKAKGVVAFSSGNHAQGVAAAGTLLGIRTAIVMPEDAPAAKIRNTRKLGGETVLYDRYTGDREQIARSLAEERGAVLVPSYDHPDIITGQGTVGLEIMQQCTDVQPEQMLVSCSGGGLIAGCAIAAHAFAPDLAVYAIEPEGMDDTARSLVAGERLSNAAGMRNMCDALQAATPGRMTFDINRTEVAAGFSVTDEEVAEAMRFAFSELKLVVEPGGAVGLAAALAGRVRCEGKTTVVILSGGNVDVELFATVQRAG